MKWILCCTSRPLSEIALRTVLGAEGEFGLAAVCRTHADILQRAPQIRPHLILHGVETDAAALAELRRILPSSPIVLWDRDVTPQQAEEATQAGVRSFLGSRATPEQIHECLAVASRGGSWVDPALCMTMLTTSSVALSARQLELVRLLVQGLKNKEIASSMGLSEHTVKSYLTVLFEKLEVKDRFELALYGLKNMSSLTARPLKIPPRSANLIPALRQRTSAS